MLFILLFVAMCLLDWKLDTYAFFKTMGTPVLGLALLIFGGSLASNSVTQSETPIRLETFVSGGFTRSRSGDEYFTYSNEEGTFSLPVDSLKMEEGTSNKVKTYLTTYPKIYKYLFFLNDKEYYIVENKP